MYSRVPYRVAQANASCRYFTYGNGGNCYKKPRYETKKHSASVASGASCASSQSPAATTSAVVGAGSDASPLVWEPACSNAACPETDIAKRLAAHKAAKAAKVTVLVLGLTHNQKNNDNSGGDAGATHENEGHDRTTIAFPPGQLSLAAELSAKRTGTPLICVLVHGGSLAPATLMRE